MNSAGNHNPGGEGRAHTIPLTSMEFGYVVRFLAIGALNTFVGLSVIYLCKYALSLSDVPANVIGYAVGLCNSFVWNRRWTFSHSGKISSAAVRFGIVFLAAYFVNLGVLLSVNSIAGMNSYLAHAIAAIPYTVLSYLGNRYYVFHSRTLGY
jgi:putative flippase GtrA